ncbi:MAG: rRNA pseudouridine synthase [Clostridiales bacterium]|nr:rRNA pseudouridine synthase [Clostridiales bacterium]
MRINKYLSGCGLDSRRKCEKLVTDGRVRVNGKTVTDLATDIKESDSVEVDGKYVTLSERKVYIMLNKPKGCVCTASDDKGRKTVLDFVKIKERIFPVGRLDYDTEGLLLLTNDGELANIITHPKNMVKKVYQVRVEGEVTDAELKKLRSGVEHNGIKYAPARVAVLEKDDKHTKLEITVTEGKNHEIKNMIESLGKQVVFLKRTEIAGIRLGGLSRGEWRFLNSRESEHLKSLK